MPVGSSDPSLFGGSQLGAHDGCRQRQGRAGSLIPRGAHSTIILTTAGTSACFWSKPNWQCLLTHLRYQQRRMTDSSDSLQKKKSQSYVQPAGKVSCALGKQTFGSLKSLEWAGSAQLVLGDFHKTGSQLLTLPPLGMLATGHSITSPCLFLLTAESFLVSAA